MSGSRPQRTNQMVHMLTGGLLLCTSGGPDLPSGYGKSGGVLKWNGQEWVARMVGM